MSTDGFSPVSEVPPPPGSKIADWFKGADLIDSYAARLRPGDNRDIRAIAEASLGDPAPWFRMLLATTAVRCHNLPGRSYLRAITPFHRTVVRSSVRRAIR